MGDAQEDDRVKNTEPAEWDEKSEQLFLEPGDRVPAVTDFGFCSYDDAPPALGGGFPWFHWFESKSEMLAALNEHSAYLYRPRGELDLETIDAVVKALIVSADGDLETLRIGLNEKLSGLAQFIWLGSFADLCSSDQSEAKRIRGQFQDDGQDRPIAAEEVDEFAEFTATYGV